MKNQFVCFVDGEVYLQRTNKPDVKRQFQPRKRADQLTEVEWILAKPLIHPDDRIGETFQFARFFRLAEKGFEPFFDLTGVDDLELGRRVRHTPSSLSNSLKMSANVNL